MRPGERGAEPHVHQQHVDGFYVLQGEIACGRARSWSRSVARAGTLVLIPPGVVHGFDNDGPGGSAVPQLPRTRAAGSREYLRGDGDFDQFDPPADGGRPAADAIVTAAGGGERFQREDRAVTILGDLPEISAFLLEVEPGVAGDRRRTTTTTRSTRSSSSRARPASSPATMSSRAGPGDVLRRSAGRAARHRP